MSTASGEVLYVLATEKKLPRHVLHAACAMTRAEFAGTCGHLESRVSPRQAVEHRILETSPVRRVNNSCGMLVLKSISWSSRIQTASSGQFFSVDRSFCLVHSHTESSKPIQADVDIPF